MNPFQTIIIAAFCVLMPSLRALPIPDAVFTAGTTVTDDQNRSWAFVSIRPSEAGALKGRLMEIHLKNGLPGDPGTFTKMGVVAPELEESVLNVLLERGRRIGENLTELDGILYDLYRTRTGEKNSLKQSGPAPPKPPLAEMLSSLLARATVDAETAQLLRVLGQAHPSVKMALGEGWAGPLSVAQGQPVTLEVRDWSAAGPGGVLGRVTLTAGVPVLLPAPGPPVQVPDLTPKGDLNVKLRWGQEDDLRRQSPLSGGFRIWRMLRAFAVENGVDAAAPSFSQLQTWVTEGNAVQVSEKPVLASQLMSLVEASDMVADPTTYFLTDDGQRYRMDAAGVQMDDPLLEGSEFTYFITSLDLLGRDGPPSLPGHAVVCRTLPPPVPSDLRVENYWAPDADAATGTQTLQFFWQSNTNTARDVTHHYEIFRGTDLSRLQSPEGKALLEAEGPIAGNQAHTADAALMSFIDVTPEALAADFGETLWYSVRAVHLSPLGPIKSDFAAPVMIAKRQREGPPAPSGWVEINCGRASVIFTSQEITQVPDQLANDGLIRIRLLCQRLDPGIAHVDLSVRIGTEITDLGRHIYPAEGDWVAADFELPANALPAQSLVAICQSTTHTGMLSNMKETTLTHLGPEGRREATFQTKSLANSDLVPGDAFSDELLESPRDASALVTQAGLGFAVTTPTLNGRHVVIQTNNPVAAVSSWTNRGHALVRDSQLYFQTPPVPEGEAPPLIGCRVFPIRDFGGTCTDLAFNPGTGQAGKLGVIIFTTLRTAEYRLFRRINDGPYTLVGQGAGSYAATDPVNAVRREDDALPMTDCTICYYTQTVDRDGNASAMVRLEPCIERKSPVLPKPRLSPPEAIGTAAEAKMKLTWMCPPQGVERFVITIKAKGGAAAQSTLENASTYSLVQPISSALAGRTVNYLSADSEGKVTPTQQAAGPATQAGNGDNMAVLNLPTARLFYQKWVQTSSFVTPPLGNSYPADPPFTAEFVVQPGVTCSVFVQAVRGLMLNGLGRGPASAKYDFKWEEPVAGPEPEVAWPARPLPEVTLISGVAAAEIDPVLWPATINGQRPVGVKLASLPSQGTEDFFTVASEIVYAPRPPSPGFRRHNPNAHLPRPLGDGIRQVQGVVLYRQQVANQLFPEVSGDTIQVSPLVHQIAWIPTTLDDRNASRLVDPFFAIKVNAPPNGNYSLDLHLLDTQGVINGARYHYYLVCFGADGEITQTIDAGFYGPN
jgi:hypothetical protein